MKRKYFLAFLGIVVLVVAGMIMIDNYNKQKTRGYIQQIRLPAFKASKDFYLTQGESKQFSLNEYNITVEYLSSSPQIIKFTVDNETRVVTITGNEGCTTSYKEECNVKNNEKECKLVPERTRCRIARICLKDYVVFGIASGKDSWNTTSLYISSAVTFSSCS